MSKIKNKMPQTFASLIETIENSDSFRNFKDKNPYASLCAGFFVVDYRQEGGNQQQLDYFLPDGKIFTFILTKEITIKEAETIQGQKIELKNLNKEIKADLDDVKNILKREFETQGINKKINKIIAILQNYQDKQIWNLTLMLEGFAMIQCHIDSFSGEILKFEQKSMFDFVKKVE